MTRARPSPVVDALFFATVFTVTFAKLQWEVAGTLSLSDVLTAVFLVVYAATRLGTGDRRLAWGAAAGQVGAVALRTYAPYPEVSERTPGPFREAGRQAILAVRRSRRRHLVAVDSQQDRAESP